MAHPKRRHSKARRDRRRTHDSLAQPGSSICSNCGERKLSHRMCPHCGHYRGREIIQVDDNL